MDVLVWAVLIAIAVSDAKEHRIPNVLLLVVVILVLINKAFILHDYSLLFWSFASGSACFFGALLFYFMKVMAPGDVKLLGVVGFWLGTENTLDAIFWIAVASVTIGMFYAFLRMADRPEQTKVLFRKYSILALYGRSSLKSMTSNSSQEERYRMPFAPVVVIGLAMHQYF
ncbi:hypothetical protein TW81_01390 [Vibrio galatheae]|uniref:Prepilin type IV endopeptidase peptidase domain-containing protein n=1 Tax=Vibrio galatheae TaxID=579748 RepID=A0A0F4NPD6_9VIBR|nr:A24 family peptidase [Vibrio galatheae]KJY85005.1 hypothetical protein TW81_01390 [Vibrio galatheae]